MMKRLCLIIACALCFVLLPSCTGTELSKEETHQLCEEYGERIRWLCRVSGSYDMYPHSVKETRRILSETRDNGREAWCVATVISTELDTGGIIDSANKEVTSVWITFEVDEVLWGDMCVPGERLMTRSSFFPDDEVEQPQVGERYVALFTNTHYAGHNQMHGRWAFYLTEDNRLVSPFGCAVEEEQQRAEFEAQNPDGSYTRYPAVDYTGKTLEQFYNDVLLGG